MGNFIYYLKGWFQVKFEEGYIDNLLVSVNQFQINEAFNIERR